MFTEEDYVSLETAKLLKEKGFDEDCEYYICVDNGCVFYKGRINAFIKTNKTSYKCPTLYEAQKWLRGKGLVVEVSYMYGDYYIYEILTAPKHDLIGLGDRPSINYKTYEQALDEGIKEALRLIE